MRRWKAKLLIFAETVLAVHYGHKSKKAALAASAKHWYRNAQFAKRSVPYHELIVHEYMLNEDLRHSDTCALCIWCKKVTKEGQSLTTGKTSHCNVCPLKDDPNEVCCDRWFQTRYGSVDAALNMVQRLADKYTALYNEPITIGGVTYHPHNDKSEI